MRGTLRKAVNHAKDLTLCPKHSRESVSMWQTRARCDESAAAATQETSSSLHHEPAEGGGAHETGWMQWAIVVGDSFLASLQNVLCRLNGIIK